MLVVEEGVSIRLTKVGLQTTDGYVHVGHLPCRGVGFLSVNADMTQLLLMVGDKLGTLHKHTTRAAAGVIDTTFVRLQNFYDGTHDATGGIEFAGILTFHRGKLLQAVFIDASQ